MKWLAFLLVGVALIAAPVMAQETVTEAHTTLVEAWFQTEATHDYSRMGEFFAENVVRHSAATTAAMPGSQVTNLEEYAAFLQETAAGFPDYRVTPLMLVAEADYVVWYGIWTGTFVGNGNLVTVPMTGIFRFDGEKIVEVWSEWDNFSWGAQMNDGAPPPEIVVYEPPEEGSFDLEANHVLVQALFTADEERNFEQARTLLSDDFTSHSVAFPGINVASGDDYAAFLQGRAEAAPDFLTTAEIVVAQNDLVGVYAVQTWMDFDRTGLPIELPVMTFFRIEDDKIAEMWVEADNLAIVMQTNPPPTAEA